MGTLQAKACWGQEPGAVAQLFYAAPSWHFLGNSIFLYFKSQEQSVEKLGGH
jgi:hypothetical protein